MQCCKLQAPGVPTQQALAGDRLRTPLPLCIPQGGGGQSRRDLDWGGFRRSCGKPFLPSIPQGPFPFCPLAARDCHCVGSAELKVGKGWFPERAGKAWICLSVCLFLSGLAFNKFLYSPLGKSGSYFCATLCPTLPPINRSLSGLAWMVTPWSPAGLVSSMPVKSSL